MNQATMRVKVARRSVEAEDICSFELAPLDGGRLPRFSAGSHIDVHLPGGLVRQYSLCNDPSDAEHYMIAVLKDAQSRGGSVAVHEHLQLGVELEIGAPRNHFALAHGASRHVLVAGGIGITPVLCMAYRLAAIGEAFELHYCTRSPQRTAFLDAIRRSGIGERTTFHFDSEGPEQRLDLDSLVGSLDANAHLYVCGPKPFMDWVLDGARRRDWSEERLHYEFFGAEIDVRDSDEAFEVQLASSGRVIVVSKGRTVVQALTDAGIDIPTSCEQGVCGTCLVRVIEGEPDHRDLFLTPEERVANNQFTPCCSRSKSMKLVLDL